MPDVRLVDLEIIKRFSLAVRQEFADAEDVLEALDASRDAVRKAVKASTRKSTARKPAKKRTTAGARSRR